MNGFESYVITYAILGSILSYYIILIGRRLDDLRVRIKEAELKLQVSNSEEE